MYNYDFKQMTLEFQPILDNVKEEFVLINFLII